MTEESEPPKKKIRLDLNPNVEVETSIGPVFFREPGYAAISGYAKQSLGDASTQVRELISSNTSKTESKAGDEKAPVLTQDEVSSLTEEDFEKISAAFLSTTNGQYYIAQAEAANPSVQRDEGESAVVFFDRLLRWLAEDQKRAMEELRQTMRGNGLLDKLSTRSRTLEAFTATQRLADEALRNQKLIDQNFGSETLRAFNKLTDGASGITKMVDDIRRQKSHFDEIRKLAELQSGPINVTQPNSFRPENFTVPRLPTVRDGLREMTEDLIEAEDLREKQRQVQREEELQINRNMGEMTIKSSELLAELTRVSADMLGKFSVFLIEFKESAQTTNAGTRKTLRWAVASLVITAALTLVALGVSYASFKQDKADIASDDLWQAEVTNVLRAQATAGEKARQDLANENVQLRQRIEALEKAAIKSVIRPVAKPLVTP